MVSLRSCWRSLALEPEPPARPCPDATLAVVPPSAVAGPSASLAARRRPWTATVEAPVMTTSLHEPAAAEVGRLLREARLARGEELAAAATGLRGRPAHLDALEAGRLGRLLAPVYVVGQTRAYARHLGLDGAELGRRLKVSGDHGGAPDAERPKPAAGRWRAAASLVGLLLLGAVAYAGYRAGSQRGRGPTPAPPPAPALADPGGTAA